MSSLTFHSNLSKIQKIVQEDQSKVSMHLFWLLREVQGAMDKGAKKLGSHREITSVGFNFLICATDVYIRAIEYFPILMFHESRRDETIFLVLTSQSLLPFKILLLFFFFYF